MVNIRVYLRMRPTADASSFISENLEDSSIQFDLPQDRTQGWVNNTRLHYSFKFDGLFPMKTTQKDIFEECCAPAVKDLLAGINSTVFAYGQTGSGKTYTITGGPGRYQDRGMIPRTLGLIYSTPPSDAQYKVFISYLEIYNETCFDLLAPNHKTGPQKVIIREDDNHEVKLVNLSSHYSPTLEDALNLLFLGDTNRVLSATALNDCSSRSHCLFLINVQSFANDSVRKATMHLVDLAGSERVAKTGATGFTLRDANYINLSLLFLEQVIIALRQKARNKQTFVPYRSSMMTLVLKNSLGGNCKTVMVATAACDDGCLDESISTCRFAETVAGVENIAIVNEEQDPYLVIARLQGQVKDLQEQIARLEQGEARTDLAPIPTSNRYKGALTNPEPLAEEEVEYVSDYVQQFMSEGNIPDQYLYETPNRSILALTILKNMCNSINKMVPDYSMPQRTTLSAPRQAVMDQGVPKYEPYFIDCDEMRSRLQTTQQQAHELSIQMDECRTLITHMKSKVEEISLNRVLTATDYDYEDQMLINQLEVEKLRYTQLANDLREIDGEIAGIQHTLKHNQQSARGPNLEYHSESSPPIAPVSPSLPKSSPNIFIGDVEADSEIAAFYEVRDRVFK
eukprot:Platyproteum_vivax@DN7751_c0_g1_i1.p1